MEVFTIFNFGIRLVSGSAIYGLRNEFVYFYRLAKTTLIYSRDILKINFIHMLVILNPCYLVFEYISQLYSYRVEICDFYFYSFNNILGAILIVTEKKTVERKKKKKLILTIYIMNQYTNRVIM